MPFGERYGPGRRPIGAVARTAAEQARIEKKRDRAIERRACANPRRRRRLEKDCCAWLRHYMPAAFPLPFSVGHRAMIAGALQAAETGTGSAVAAPRGEGKTTILRGVCLYLVATGRARFPLMAGWTHKSATEGFRVWLRMLHTSPEFRADYPELTQPFEESTHSARLKNLTWADTETECGAEIRAVDKCLVLPSSRGAIAAASVQGDVKGLSVTLHDGSVLRPDLLLIDDAQDPKRAENPAFVRDTIETIEKQWMCLAGPQSRIVTMVACTVAAAGDVSEHFLTRHDFRATRIARVLTWPAGWDEKGGESRRLWDEWHQQFLEGLHDGDGGKRGLVFYRANRAGMTTGMTVSWEQRMDKQRGDPDAMYSAMFDLYRIGPQAFASEYQNQPINQGVTLYNLTPDVICSRATDRAPGVVPEWVRWRVAATDVNPSYGLSWSLIGFGTDQTAAVMGYGVYPLSIGRDATEAEKARAIYEAFVLHGKALAGLPCRPELWLFDGRGWHFDTALRFGVESQHVCGLQAIPTMGYGWRNYRPFGRTIVGKPREQCHMSADVHGRKWISFNADYWREIAQKGWTGSVGAPGSCSLPTGQHREFAEQVCREQLAGKDDVGGRTVWVWNTAPGKHDFDDCMTLGYVGAAWGGIGTGGQVTRPVSRRRPGGVTVIPM